MLEIKLSTLDSAFRKTPLFISRFLLSQDMTKTIAVFLTPFMIGFILPKTISIYRKYFVQNLSPNCNHALLRCYFVWGMEKQVSKKQTNKFTKLACDSKDDQFPRIYW